MQCGCWASYYCVKAIVSLVLDNYWNYVNSWTPVFNIAVKVWLLPLNVFLWHLKQRKDYFVWQLKNKFTKFYKSRWNVFSQACFYMKNHETFLKKKKKHKQKQNKKPRLNKKSQNYFNSTRSKKAISYIVRIFSSRRTKRK